jgi:hypothetical protein
MSWRANGINRIFLNNSKCSEFNRYYFWTHRHIVFCRLSTTTIEILHNMNSCLGSWICGKWFVLLMSIAMEFSDITLKYDSTCNWFQHNKCVVFISNKDVSFKDVFRVYMGRSRMIRHYATGLIWNRELLDENLHATWIVGFSISFRYAKQGGLHCKYHQTMLLNVPQHK